jgi:hypothetical protein
MRELGTESTGNLVAQDINAEQYVIQPINIPLDLCKA